MLFQYDNDEVLHPVAFYSKSIIPAECNYHIYNKKLLAIIRYFEHWRPELEDTNLLIQVFIDYQVLKTFMKNKKLTRRQARYLDILFEFNFQVIFRSRKRNIKINTLIKRLDARPLDSFDERAQY